jgi:hypothetical protein
VIYVRSFFSLVDKFVSLLEAGPLNFDLSKVSEVWHYCNCALQISGLEGVGERHLAMSLYKFN